MALKTLSVIQIGDIHYPQAVSIPPLADHKDKGVSFLLTERFPWDALDVLKIPKERKLTKRSKSSVQKRLETKKKLGLKKAYRKRPDDY